MTDLQNYKLLINGIFGSGTAAFNAQNTATNNVIGALAAKGDYHSFTSNFIARLKRLNLAYGGQHPSRVALITQVNEVASVKNWDGAVSELAAIDFFTERRNFLPRVPDLDVTIPVARALSSGFGMQQANLDLHFPDFDVYTDVKVLKDVVSEILNGVYKQTWPTAPRPLISHEYPADASYDDVAKNRQKILKRIQSEIATGRQPLMIDCTQDVPGLRLRLDWTRGVLVTESSYSPYKHAEDLHGLAFHHAKKFVTDRPFFLTFVMFPWFNNGITDFRDANKIFYRSFARRIFCQYRNTAAAFSTLSPSYTGNETIHEVAQKLDGVLFLEDQSISATTPNKANVRAYYYENPNGEHPPSQGLMDAYLKESVDGDFDDFRCDNY